MKIGKSVYALTLIALLLLVMTSCSHSHQSATTSNTNSSTATSSDSISPPPTNKATKIIKDGLEREVEIPTKPERIVVLGNMGEVLALGIKPIGTLDYYLNKFERERIAGIESVGGDEPSMEKMIALEPDLIIIPGYFKPEIVEALQKIAPTVATKWGLLPLEHLSVLAEWLGREEEEQAWLAHYAEKAAQTKEALKPYQLEGEKVIVLQFWNKMIYQHATTVFTPLFQDIGFKPTEAQAKVTQTKAISEEAVVEYAQEADRLFILVDGQEDIDMYQHLKDTAWKNIPAVQNDKVMLVDSPRWNDYSTAAMEWMLEDLVNIFK